MATCTECDTEIDVDEFDVDRGDQLSCPECGTNLEVVSLSPVELGLLSEDEDDETDDGNEADDDSSEDEWEK